MESLLFFLSSLAMIVLVFMGLRDDRRRSGTAATSYFRYIEDDASDSDGAGTRAKRTSSARKPVEGRRP